MDKIMAFISLLFFIALIVGLIKPSAVLGFMKTKTRGRVFLVYGLPFFLIPFFSGLIKGPSNPSPPTSSSQPSPSPQVSEQKEALRAQDPKGGSILYKMFHGDSDSSSLQPSPPSAPLDSTTEIQSYAVQLFEKVTDSKVNWGSDLRKVRGVKASKVSDKKYSLIIDFRIDDNLTSNMRRGYMFDQIKDFLETVNTDKPLENVNQFFFQGFFPLQDKYGNAEEKIVVNMMITKNLIRKINWENMFDEKLMSLLSSEGNLRMHPAME